MSQENNIVLPKDVTLVKFTEAVKEFRSLVGNENVLVESEQLVSYTKIMMPRDVAENTPSAAVTATSIEHVQGVVKICNKYNIPVWTISTGNNLGYGSSAPVQRGQVILDLKKMNKIIDVDVDMATALVEPGVTYQQLYDYLEDNNIPLMCSMPGSSAIAGPMGNIMDRGVGYTPYGEHFMMQCGMEQVLANGDIYRTGMGGVQGENSWQVFKWGYGPTLDGMFTQGNYGICTKIGFWLMPKPPVIKPFSIEFEDDTDIADIVEFIRPLRISTVIPNAVVIAGILWEAATAGATRAEYTSVSGPTPDSVLKQIQKDKNLGAWNVYASLYGSPEQVEVNWNIIKGALKQLGKGKLITEEDAGGTEPFDYRAKLMTGVPNLQEFGLYNWRGGGGSMWFAPVSQARGSECDKQYDLAKKILNKYGLDYVGEFIVGWRDMHHVIDVLYDRSNKEESKRAEDCFNELLDVFEENGYAVYRVNTQYQERVAQSYGPVKRRVEHAIKRALDPNNILAPGKSGIDLDNDFEL
jgi:4-cresol dehydrogenase (hydroxylating)